MSDSNQLRTKSPPIFILSKYENSVTKMNNNHLWTLFNDAHWRSLDNICSHPLEAKDIEDLAEDLGLQIIADQLRENREDQERRENE